MRFLALGDIVANVGRDGIKKKLPAIVNSNDIDFVIANAENSAGGSGITPTVADELFRSGVHVLTSGDHIWKKKEIETSIGQYPYLLRPANFPESAPGKGFCIYKLNGISICVISLLGRVFMNTLVECPFKTVKSIIDSIKSQTQIIFVDFHAEATSEKIAMGWYLDGIASCVFGTHTHVQTSDERILPKGTGYITDVGMTGSIDSVLGRERDNVIQKFLTSMPMKFEIATSNVELQGVIVEVDNNTGKAVLIKRVREKA